MVNRTFTIDFLKYQDLIAEYEDVIKKRELKMSSVH
jgi:hypothetical protein